MGRIVDAGMTGHHFADRFYKVVFIPAESASYIQSVHRREHITVTISAPTIVSAIQEARKTLANPTDWQCGLAYRPSHTGFFSEAHIPAGPLAENPDAFDYGDHPDYPG